MEQAQKKTREALRQLAVIIYDSPQKVITILQRHKIAVPATPTLPDINYLVYNHLGNEGVRDEVINLGSGYDNFIDPVTITMTVVSLVSTVKGIAEQKKKRDAENNLAIMQVEQNTALSKENIDAEADADRKQILLNTAVAYKKGLGLEEDKTKATRNMWLWFSAAALSTLFLFMLVYKKRKTA